MSKYSDEDWAVISSSSDVDDESNCDKVTDSGVLATADDISGDSEKNDQFPQDSVSSITTLKLPKVDDIAHQKQGTEEDANSKISDENDAKSDVNLKITDLNDTHENEAAKDGEAPETTISVPESPIYSKIRFYESLSQFNESIKQKSNNFYHNFAKLKIDQLNNYVAEDLWDNEEHDDIIDEDTVYVNNDNTVLNGNEDSSSIFQVILLRAIQCIQSFLENNSKYLYYYAIIILAALSSITIYKMIPANISPTEVTALDKVGQFLDTVIYEQEIPSGFFLWNNKKRKINRVAKYSDLFHQSMTEKSLKVKQSIFDYYDSTTIFLEDFTISNKLHDYVQNSKQKGEYYWKATNQLYLEFQTKHVQKLQDSMSKYFEKLNDLSIDDLQIFYSKSLALYDEVENSFIISWKRGYRVMNGYSKIGYSWLVGEVNDINRWVVDEVNDINSWVADEVNDIKRVGDSELSKVKVISKTGLHHLADWFNKSADISKQKLSEILTSFDKLDQNIVQLWNESNIKLLQASEAFESNFKEISLRTYANYKALSNNILEYINDTNLQNHVLTGKYYLDTVSINIYRQSKKLWKQLAQFYED